MDNDWHDFHKLASALLMNDLKSCSQECIYRNVISRSYYAAFHHVQFLLYQGAISKTDNSSIHEQVASDFLAKANIYTKEAVDGFFKLRKWRVQSDYRFRYKGLLDVDARQAIVFTRTILNINNL